MIPKNNQWLDRAVASWKHRNFVRRRIEDRYESIESSVKSASKDSILLVGNSHVEFLDLPDLAGRPCINLGIGGSTACDCLSLLSRLQPPTRSEAAVLIVGTNDIMRWRRPDLARSERRFEADVRRILQHLKAYTSHVFVAAVPPIGLAAKSRDPACVASFSARLETLCAEGGNTFFDPFASLRDGGPGLATCGLHRDGVHMANYAQLKEEVVRLVAPRVGAIVSARPEATSKSADSHKSQRSFSKMTFGAAVRAMGRPHSSVMSDGL